MTAPFDGEPTQLDRIESMLHRLLVQTAPKAPGEDESVYRDPKEKYWTGESYVGSKMSECPPDYLRALAKYKSACAWANRKEGDPNKAQYAEKDDRTAALARMWADYQDAIGESPQRSRQAASQQESNAPAGEDDIPF